tara:strand:+ start:84 stop:257 length:174 start_codon:yes stop_codon:yes gene_type:complete
MRELGVITNIYYYYSIITYYYTSSLSIHPSIHPSIPEQGVEKREKWNNDGTPAYCMS